MNKDYYAILGISSAANQEEIRLAYEKMTSPAGKFSPPPEKRAQIEEAYFILSNPQTRFQYDRAHNNTNHLVKNFDGFDGSRINLNGLIGMAENTSVVSVSGLNSDDDFDDPEGMLPENFTDIFQTAIKNIIIATDRLKSVKNSDENIKNGEDIFLDLPIGLTKTKKGGYFPLEYRRYIYCSQCQISGGKNIREKNDCPKCSGAGRVLAYRRVEIKIPKDIVNGAVLQIAKEGHVPGGDLFVKIIFRDEV